MHICILAKIICVESRSTAQRPAFCHLPYHTENDKNLLWEELDCVHLTHKVEGSVEPLLISCFLAFCSLSGNKVTAEGARELAAALQVNQTLQELK